MIAELERPEAQAPLTRLTLVEALLDLCLATYAQPCLVTYAPKYIEAAVAAAPSEPAARRLLALKAAYYLDAARASVAEPKVTAQILSGEQWKQESTLDPALYLRRQRLAADILLQQDDFKAAGERADRVLSLIAALKNPQDDRFSVATTLSDTIATLLAAGQTERAFGIYAASGGMIARSLPPLTVEAVTFHLTEAQLLQETGRTEGASKALDVAVESLGRMELDSDTADWLLGRALTLKAAVCVFGDDLACAKSALDRHPFAGKFAHGERPQSYDETGYLAVRSLVAAMSGASDPVAAEALARSARTNESLDVQAAADVYRAAGRALALPPGAARTEALRALGGRVTTFVAREPHAAFGAWRRVGMVDRLVVALALGATSGDGERKDAGSAFLLTQLAQRGGPSFDADAQTLLDQARNEDERREIHRTLRLKARRDRGEREEIARVAAEALKAAPRTGGWLTYDVSRRGVLRDFAESIEKADRRLAADGLATSGANLVPLARFQAVLAPGEVALAVTPLAGDLAAYVCVRRDRVVRSVGKADFQRARIDARVIQAGLTAGHAPSEALDSQFPVEASIRLYDLLIRPFGTCVKPGDRIIWLPHYATFGVPLSVLLEHAPPRQDRGYDLAQAAWLVRDHAVVYPGSASMIVAARGAGAHSGGDFDFLGVGDPALKRAQPGGAVDVSGLEALPETRRELEESAKGFRSVRLLTGEAATESNFRGQLLGSYRFLSFATHGLIRNDLPGLSEPSLVLTPAPGDGEAGDGLLTADEIADLSLSARFVALSACNTANYDPEQSSQDLPALASAFAVAGVPSTLATLWPVESETSRRVVTATFAALRVDRQADAADALAAAQRAFLAAPPSKAYLHPRFWAPFILLGDGAAPKAGAAPSDLGLDGVVNLTRGGGEVIALRQESGRTLARVTRGAVGQAPAGSAVIATEGDALAWTQESDGVGATQVLFAQGATIAAGGRVAGSDGAFRPVLQRFDPASGRELGEWRGDDPHAVVAAGAELPSGGAAVLVVEAGSAGAGGQGVRLLLTDGEGPPRPLSSTRAPAGAALSEATVAPLGDAVLVTYSTRSGPVRRIGPANEDDYDLQICAGAPASWMELRDLRTGRLLGSKTLPGYLLVAAKPDAEGRVVVAGAKANDCASDRRALVLSVGRDLRLETLHLDDGQGASEARGLAVTKLGPVVAVSEVNVLDYRRPAAGPRPPGDRAGYASGMVVALGRKGEVRATKRLDSGGDLFLDDVAVGPAREVTVGGALGGEATLIRLHTAGRLQ